MFNFKSSTRLTIFSTGILFVVFFAICIFVLSTIQNDSINDHYAVTDEILQYIIEDISLSKRPEDIRYPYTYYILYDSDKKIIYDGSNGQYARAFDSLKYISERIFFDRRENAYCFYGKIDNGQYIKLVNIAMHTENLFGGLIGGLFILFAVSTAAFFFASSLIVDRILNPLRLMTEKVKSIGNKNFSERLYIDSTDDELVEYSKVFNEMAEKINQYVQKQKHFISDASHELVTPITVIVGHTDLLLRWGKEDRQILESELKIIKDEALAMNSLIERLLFFARSDNNTIKYNFEKIDISKLVSDCINEQLSISDFGYAINNYTKASCMGDYDGLKRVLRIVFTNGIKYSFDEKLLTVDITEVNNFVEIAVSDKGIGIDEIYFDKIFERFFRIDDSRAKDSGGTGLGLAIAKEITQYHKGVIFAKNNPGGGTTIVLRLPMCI